MTARHRLPEASPGEREEHAHQYLVEVVARGAAVDELGYLVDISELKGSLAAVLERYRGRCLNELDDFRSLVPSLEVLARAIWRHISSDLAASAVSSLTVRVWEDDDAWASHEGEMNG
jgi:6-pyruvoyltetrahydropterin/6-carboxytetrahydropterin synthase